MTTLRFAMDDLFGDQNPGIRRYGIDLARAVALAAPEGCSVVGVISQSSVNEERTIRDLLPELADVTVLPVSREQLRTTWSVTGFTRPLTPGILHSPTDLAPLFASTPEWFNQSVLTLHSASLWLGDRTLSRKQRFFNYVLRTRIERYAAAVVVNTQALADILGRVSKLGDRVKVIPGAPSPELARPTRMAGVSKSLGLPRYFFLAVAPAEQAERNRLIKGAMLASRPEPIYVIGTKPNRDALRSALSTEPSIAGSFVFKDEPTDEETAVLIARASAVVYLSPADRDMLSVIDVLAAKTPLIFASWPELLELTGGAGVVLDNAIDADTHDLADAMDSLARTRTLAQELTLQGLDRAAFFSWDDVGTAIWQLQADA